MKTKKINSTIILIFLSICAHRKLLKQLDSTA